MPTVVPTDTPEIVELIARRRRLGHDRHDEMWEGVYHVAPEAGSPHGQLQAQILVIISVHATSLGYVPIGPFNLGVSPTSFRVPDFGLLAEPLSATWVPTALIVGEILSPDDETWEKFPYYAARGVAEIWVIDPPGRTVQLFRRRDETRFDEVAVSQSLGVAAVDLATGLRWPYAVR